MESLEFILIGHPVAHSMSPAIHSAVYRRYDLSHRYTVVDCPDEPAVVEQVARLRRGEIAGANVTVPYKRFALSLADEVDVTARDTGAANVLATTSEGRVIAYNTDVAALRERIVAGARSPLGEIVVLGAGGAALAAVVAARQAGATQISVSARSWTDETDPEQWRAIGEFRALGALPLAWHAGRNSELASACSTAAVTIQATSAGMLGHGGGETVVDLVPWSRLRSDAFFYDVVYNPPVTPFLQKARSLGLRAEGGLSMLVGQAALAIDIWLALDAPRAEMTAAAERLLLGMKQ